ncbi:MAG: type II toxin-antitoxin system VapC family toxin [Spirochaetaceae bacterium]|nr:type II toxin-antitoxin system VapC family toxin [Spirochaetaceae bacterium]
MKQLLIDSSVLLDILTDDPRWAERSVRALAGRSSDHQLCINDITFAEVSIGFRRIEDLRTAVAGLQLEHLSIPHEALFLAGKAFLVYRRRGGVRAQPLPDFFIGAHAAVSSLPLLTRDPVRIRTAFPTVEIISP